MKDLLIEKIKEQLFQEIEELKGQKGLIRAGLPHYGRFFGRDSLITAWQILHLDPENCRKTLKALSELQGKVVNDKREEEPGKILHETDFELKRHPKGYFPFPYYGSVDSTCWYVILFYFYFLETKDLEFIKKYWKNIVSAVNWMEEYGDADQDYFLEYERKNPTGLFHQGWKDSSQDIFKVKPPIAIVEVQGYEYLALKGAAVLAKELGDADLPKKFLSRAEELKKNFNEKFWMKDKKFFALALGVDKKQRKVITSSPGHLLFCGIVDKDKEKLVVQRLFQEDLWTPYGIRTHSAKDSGYRCWSYHMGSVWPHDNWIIAEGLRRLGYKTEYRRIKKATLMTFEELGFIPECFIVSNKVLMRNYRACFLQAWSTGALLNFLTT
ncbi:amylo-alpha-1,6-glucosidase [Patescibacteria group bacterium]